MVSLHFCWEKTGDFHREKAGSSKRFAAFLVGGLVVVALPQQGYFLAHENEETYGGRQTQLDMRRRRHIIVQIEMWLATVAISTSLTVGRRAESWTLPNLYVT